jgi:predicted nucleic acid-binding protein
MSELVLIDTSAWVLALRAGGPVVVRKEVEQLLATGRVATTPIVILELLTGARSSREFRELKEDLEALKQLELSPSVWERAYKLGYDLRRAGLTIPTVRYYDRSVGTGIRLSSASRRSSFRANSPAQLPADEELGVAPRSPVQRE